MGVSKNSGTPKWFIVEIPIKMDFLMDDLGGKPPIMRKHPYIKPSKKTPSRNFRSETWSGELNKGFHRRQGDNGLGWPEMTRCQGNEVIFGLKSPISEKLLKHEISMYDI